MNIIELLNELKIKIVTTKLDNEEFHDVCFISKTSEPLSNVIYISKDNKIDDRYLTSTVIYTKNVNAKGSFIIVDEDPYILFDKLHDAFVNDHQKYININNFIKEVFSSNNSTVQQIVDEAVKLFNNPIIVTNAAYKVIGINANDVYVDDPTFDNAFKFGYCSAESINWFEYEGITHKVLENSKPVYLNTGMSEKIPRLICKIIVNNTVVGFVGVLSVCKEISEIDFKNIEILASVLQTTMSNDKELLDSTNIIYKTIIKDILKGNINTDLILNERLKSAHWKIKDKLRCLIITTKNKNKKIDNTSYIMNTISKNHDMKCTIFEENILILTGYNDHKTWHRQIETIKEIVDKFDLKCGVSNEFSNMINIKSYYQEALRVLEIAQELNVKDSLFYYAAFLPYILISSIDEDTLIDLENTYYKRLKKYDDENKTDYCTTLYYYVLFNTNINRTSDKLCIHRNTLKYRLEKIMDITNIDLNNGIMLQNFVLFYQLQYYLTKKSNKENKY